MCFTPQGRARFWHLNFQKWSEHGVLCAFWLTHVLRATTACTFSTCQLPKADRKCCALYILTWKCASRHNSVHFFDISISKSGRRMVCFVHFDLEMCFAPQRRALFRHLDCQKWSEPGVSCALWLGNVLRATTACNFSSLIWPHGSAPAALASLLFDSLEPQITGNTVFRTHLHLLPSDSFSSLIFSLLLFYSLTLLTSAFPSVHIVGSLTTSFDKMHTNISLLYRIRCYIIYIYQQDSAGPGLGAKTAKARASRLATFVFTRAPGCPGAPLGVSQRSPLRSSGGLNTAQVLGGNDLKPPTKSKTVCANKD